MNPIKRVHARAKSAEPSYASWATAIAIGTMQFTHSYSKITLLVITTIPEMDNETLIQY
jgi:hypothetical protein